MIITIVSIIILTSLVWLVTKTTPIKVCPICAGVSLTWLWIFLGAFFEKLSIANGQVIVAILAGGTVVGIMSKLEDKIETKFILLWKTIFVLLGFSAVYSLITGQWVLVGISVVAVILTTYVFKIKQVAEHAVRSGEELKEKMKSCC